MSDDQGYHKLQNDFEGRSMSLHIYAQPIENCKAFDESSQQFIDKSLSFDTDKDNNNV